MGANRSLCCLRSLCKVTGTGRSAAPTRRHHTRCTSYTVPLTKAGPSQTAHSSTVQACSILLAYVRGHVHRVTVVLRLCNQAELVPRGTQARAGHRWMSSAATCADALHTNHVLMKAEESTLQGASSQQVRARPSLAAYSSNRSSRIIARRCSRTERGALHMVRGRPGAARLWNIACVHWWPETKAFTLRNALAVRARAELRVAGVVLPGSRRRLEYLAAAVCVPGRHVHAHRLRRWWSKCA